MGDRAGLVRIPGSVVGDYSGMGLNFLADPGLVAGSAGAIGGQVELLRKICAQQYELKAGAPGVVQEHAPDLSHIISIDIQFSSVIIRIVARACKKKR